MSSNILTISETAQRLKQENLTVTEYTLRLWVKSGKLPFRKAGRKNLLYYPHVINYLCADQESQVIEPEIKEQKYNTQNSIRKVGN